MTETRYKHLYGNKYLDLVPEKLYSYNYVKKERSADREYKTEKRKNVLGNTVSVPEYEIDKEILQATGRHVRKQVLVPYPECFTDVYREDEDKREKPIDTPLYDGFYKIVIR